MKLIPTVGRVALTINISMNYIYLRAQIDYSDYRPSMINSLPKKE